MGMMEAREKIQIETNRGEICIAVPMFLTKIKVAMFNVL